MSASGSTGTTANPGPSGPQTINTGLPVRDALIAQITSQSGNALNLYLKNYIKDHTDFHLATLTTNGQDPLDLLDAHQHTLGVLYILCSRLQSTSAPPPSLAVIEDFCARFDPVQARFAPDKVTALARGIHRAAQSANNTKLALSPLLNLVTRYPPNLAYLTTLHSIFLSVCVETSHFAIALPVLEVPVTLVDTALSDLHYSDNLVYHYAGGIALAALKRWREAEDFFEICVTAPAQVSAALQMEAYKKLTLVQLILYGETIPLPKYTNPILTRLLKTSPYGSFIKAYPSDASTLQALLNRYREQFGQEKNVGLMNQAIERSPRWLIKKLTSTFLTLRLADIAKEVKISSESKVREIIVSMIEDDEINASISVEGTVTFSDFAPAPPKNLDVLLKQAQDQSKFLLELERKMLTNKEYLVKAMRAKDDGWSAEDDAAFGITPGGSGGGWVMETSYV